MSLMSILARMTTFLFWNETFGLVLSIWKVIFCGYFSYFFVFKPRLLRWNFWLQSSLWSKQFWWWSFVLLFSAVEKSHTKTAFRYPSLGENGPRGCFVFAQKKHHLQRRYSKSSEHMDYVHSMKRGKMKKISYSSPMMKSHLSKPLSRPQKRQIWHR